MQRGSRLIWAFYLAAAIALVGGALPFVFGGTSSRVAGVILPFGVAAAGLVACALLHNQSRLVVAIVYFLAGLAIVYGLMSMFSLPVRLAALGSCPVAPLSIVQYSCLRRIGAVVTGPCKLSNS